MVAAALSTLSLRSFLAEAVRADGTVVARGSGGSHPVIEFTPAGGEATQFGGSGGGVALN